MHLYLSSFEVADVPVGQPVLEENLARLVQMTPSAASLFAGESMYRLHRRAALGTTATGGPCLMGGAPLALFSIYQYFYYNMRSPRRRRRALRSPLLLRSLSLQSKIATHAHSHIQLLRCRRKAGRRQLEGPNSSERPYSHYSISYNCCSTKCSVLGGNGSPSGLLSL